MLRHAEPAFWSMCIILVGIVGYKIWSNLTMVEVVGLSLLSIAVIAAILVFVEYKSVNYCSKKIPEMLSGDVTMTAAQMMANMNLEGHSVSIGTLYSVIYRLEKKGVITHEKISPKKFVYKVAKN